MSHLRPLYTVLLLALVSLTVAAPFPQEDDAGRGGRICQSYQVRKEWRSLTTTERISYINAVKCLNTLPSLDPSRGTVSRFDDFAYSHVVKTNEVHFVGQFLPWHRHFLNLYDKATRVECGYTGPTPYWDGTVEGDSAAPFESSSLFDTTHGFGGNGVPGTYTLPPDPNGELEIPPFPGNPPADILWSGCVQTGPFRDTVFRVNVGPGRMMTNHCVVRNFNPTSWKANIASASVATALAPTTFWAFTEALNIGPHLGGHAILGGIMSNTFSTPGDPLFYLHHGGIDRLWLTWQVSAPGRLTAIGGPNTYPPGSAEVDLDFVLDFPGIGAPITVRSTMNINDTPNCYYYDSLPNVSVTA